MRRVFGTPALLLATGCATLGIGGAVPGVAGVWEGSAEVQGQLFEGALEVEQNGSALTAVFRAPSFGLVAEGYGQVESDRSIVLVLGYDLQCPGEARLEGRVSPTGDRITGRIEARDCTGEVVGSFDVVRLSTERP